MGSGLKNRLAVGRVLNALKGNLGGVVPAVARSVEQACAAMNGLAIATAASWNPVAPPEDPDNGGHGEPSERSTP